MSGTHFRRHARAVRALHRAALVLALSAQAVGCGGAGTFVWFRDLPPPSASQAAGEYVIAIGDTLAVRVYEQASLTADVKIRSDGRIGLPFIGEVVAVGKTPTALSQELRTRLLQFIVNPTVTVNVASSSPVGVSVLGEVAKQGPVTLEPGSGLLQALAQAGGPSDFADRSRIFVLRRAPQFMRIRFTYAALLQNRDGAALFPLQTGDVIVVE